MQATEWRNLPQDTLRPAHRLTGVGRQPLWTPIADSIAIVAPARATWGNLAWQIASPVILGGAIAVLYVATCVFPSL
jgi:hypothetical protein